MVPTPVVLVQTQLISPAVILVMILLVGSTQAALEQVLVDLISLLEVLLLPELQQLLRLRGRFLT
jgi:hypothetical protein